MDFHLHPWHCLSRGYKKSYVVKGGKASFRFCLKFLWFRTHTSQTQPSFPPWGQNNTITLKQIKSTITIIKNHYLVFRVHLYLSRTPFRIDGYFLCFQSLANFILPQCWEQFLATSSFLLVRMMMRMWLMMVRMVVMILAAF